MENDKARYDCKVRHMLESLKYPQGPYSSEVGNPRRNFLQDRPELLHRFLLHLPPHLAINIISVPADTRSG